MNPGLGGRHTLRVPISLGFFDGDPFEAIRCSRRGHQEEGFGDHPRRDTIVSRWTTPSSGCGDSGSHSPSPFKAAVLSDATCRLTNTAKGRSGQIRSSSSRVKSLCSLTFSCIENEDRHNIQSSRRSSRAIYSVKCVATSTRLSNGGVCAGIHASSVLHVISKWQ